VDNFDVMVDASDGTALVRPSGELDLASAPRLWSALAGLLKDGHRAVVMDLSRLTFSDCAGLRPIRRALRQGTERGTAVELRDAVPAVRRVLELTGLGPPAAAA
jgi:anti-sigma B factor antagonist